MLMHDASHSGHTASTLDISNGLHLQWKFSFGERVEVEVQPVVADGRVYVGVMNGKMYCLDAITGQQIWVYRAGGPIPHTAAVAGGRVFFGSLDGKVYALDAGTGAEVWVYATDAPVYSAPTVVDGTVFIGSLDGHLYALEASTGIRQWRYQTGGSVVSSPAVGDGRVYFGSEDMYAYSVQASGGQLVWKTQLHGYGMSNTYPVLSSETGVVIFVTIKPGLTSYSHYDNYPNAPEGSDIRATWRQYYNNHPMRQHLYYLDANTGVDKWDGERYQPMPLPYWGLIIPVLDDTGNAWFPSPSGVEGHSMNLDHDNRLMRIDLHTGLTVEVADRASFQVRFDETGRHTLTNGKYFYTIGIAVAVYDPATGTKELLFGTGYHAGTFSLSPLPSKHVWRYGGTRAIGLAADPSPLVVAGERGYYVVRGWLYCLGPEDVVPDAAPLRRDLAAAYWPRPSSPTMAEVEAELNSRITEIIASGHLSPTARFRQPTRLGRGYSFPFQVLWFEGELVKSLAETIPFLPQDLQSDVKDYLKAEVENYLLDPSQYDYQHQCRLYGSYDTVNCNLWENECSDEIKSCWYEKNPNLVAERLYAMWAYAHYSGDWDLIESNWEFIRELFTQRISGAYNESLGFCQFQDFLTGYLLGINQQIAGTLGILGMAAQVNDAEVQARAEHMLQGMYESRVDLAHYVQRLYDSGDLQPLEIRVQPDGTLNREDVEYLCTGGELMPFREMRDRDSDIRQVVWWDGTSEALYCSGLGLQTYAVMWGYIPMYPEVAELLRANLLAETQEYLNSYVMTDPWWWLTDLSRNKAGSGEHLYQGPALSFSLFQTKAYVLREPVEELLRQLPLPYANVGFRDLYRLQNLVAILRRAAESADTPTPAARLASVYSLRSTLENDEPVPAGAVVRAVDPDGVSCGVFTVTSPGVFGFMPVYGDDPTTPQDEGAEEGDVIRFTVDGEPLTSAPEVIWQDGKLYGVELTPGSWEIYLPLVERPPSFPAGFYGTARLNGLNVPGGTVITVGRDGVTYAQTTAEMHDGLSVYHIHVPEDDPDTPERDGGSPGEVLEFAIGDQPAHQTTTWQSGVSAALDLAAGSTPTSTPTPTNTPLPPTSTPTLTNTPVPPTNTPTPAPPIVAAVSPNHGPAKGGKSVTISGSGFKEGATVIFGGVACDPVTVVSAGEIACTSPPHVPAVVDVAVMNSDGQVGTLPHAFTYKGKLRLPKKHRAQTAIFQVPVHAEDLQGLVDAELTVTFDADVLSARGARLGDTTSGWELVANTSIPGEIQVCLGSPDDAANGTGILVWLELELVGSDGNTSVLHIANVSLNGGAIPVETADGSVVVDLLGLRRIYLPMAWRGHGQ